MRLAFVADAGQALIRALRAGGVDGRTYNAAGGAPVTACELPRLRRPSRRPSGR